MVVVRFRWCRCHRDAGLLDQWCGNFEHQLHRKVGTDPVCARGCNRHRPRRCLPLAIRSISYEQVDDGSPLRSPYSRRRQCRYPSWIEGAVSTPHRLPSRRRRDRVQTRGSTRSGDPGCRSRSRARACTPVPEQPTVDRRSSHGAIERGHFRSRRLRQRVVRRLRGPGRE